MQRNPTKLLVCDDEEIKVEEEPVRTLVGGLRNLTVSAAKHGSTEPKKRVRSPEEPAFSRSLVVDG